MTNILPEDLRAWQAESSRAAERAFQAQQAAEAARKKAAANVGKAVIISLVKEPATTKPEAKKIEAA